MSIDRTNEEASINDVDVKVCFPGGERERPVQRRRLS